MQQPRLLFPPCFGIKRKHLNNVNRKTNYCIMMKEQEFFEQIYQEHFPAIYALIQSRLHVDHQAAEDITSDVFLKLQLKWDSISPRSPAVIATWLYRAAENTILDYIKKTSRRPIIAVEPETGFEFSDHGAEAEKTIGDLDCQFLLDQIKTILTPRDWDLFLAIYVFELPRDELLKKFHLKANQFYLRKLRIREKLRKNLIFLDHHDIY